MFSFLNFQTDFHMFSINSVSFGIQFFSHWFFLSQFLNSNPNRFFFSFTHQSKCDDWSLSDAITFRFICKNRFFLIFCIFFYTIQHNGCRYQFQFFLLSLNRTNQISSTNEWRNKITLPFMKSKINSINAHAFATKKYSLKLHLMCNQSLRYNVSFCLSLFLVLFSSCEFFFINCFVCIFLFFFIPLIFFYAFIFSSLSLQSCYIYVYLVEHISTITVEIRKYVACL